MMPYDTLSLHRAIGLQPKEGALEAVQLRRWEQRLQETELLVKWQPHLV